MNDFSINYKQIGERIKAQREGRNWKQSELGEKLKPSVTGTAISMYEKADRYVSVEIISQLAAIFKIPVDYLMYGTSNTTPNIKVALRADKDIGKNDKAQEQILDFIDFIKNKSKDK